MDTKIADSVVAEETRDTDVIATSIDFEEFKERIVLKCREFGDAFKESIANGRNRDFIACCEDFLPADSDSVNVGLLVPLARSIGTPRRST